MHCIYVTNECANAEYTDTRWDLSGLVYQSLTYVKYTTKYEARLGATVPLSSEIAAVLVESHGKSSGGMYKGRQWYK